MVMTISKVKLGQILLTFVKLTQNKTNLYWFKTSSG